MTFRGTDELGVRINDGITTPVMIDASTQFEGNVGAGRYVEISAEMDSNLIIRARRIKEIP